MKNEVRKIWFVLILSLLHSCLEVEWVPLWYDVWCNMYDDVIYLFFGTTLKLYAMYPNRTYDVQL